MTELTAEEAPSKVQEYKNLEKDDVWAFICPKCEHENRLKGQPKNFANKPFKCLNCNYVPLLGKEGIEEFAETLEGKGNKTGEAGNQ